MQYAFFDKGIIQCTMEYGSWGKAPKTGEFSRIFVLKLFLQSVRLLLTLIYRNKLAVQDVLVVPSIVLLGAAAAPLSPVPAPVDY